MSKAFNVPLRNLRTYSLLRLFTGRTSISKNGNPIISRPGEHLNSSTLERMRGLAILSNMMLEPMTQHGHKIN